MKQDCPHFHVKKRTLLVIAGCVWLLAGINVTRLGLISYGIVAPIKPLEIIGSAIIFILFGTMFFRLTIKHKNRIRDHKAETRPVWHFFDLKSYVIMAFMMGGGIGLRMAKVFPEGFIAFFYTGLGLALSLAGVLFWIMFFKYKRQF